MTTLDTPRLSRPEMVAMLNSLRARRDDPKCGVRERENLVNEIDSLIEDIRIHDREHGGAR